MNILYISSANKLGGGATHALINIISALQSVDGNQCFVMYPKGNNELADFLSSKGCVCFPSHISLTIWPSFSIKKEPILWVKQLIKDLQSWYFGKNECRRIIKNYHIDLVHTNVGPLNYALPICKQAGIPHVWHIREYQREDFGMKFFPNIEYFYSNIHSPQNYCIAITKGVFQHFKLRESRDAVIYDGVFPESLFDLEINTERNNSFLFVGRVIEGKGPFELIRAFKRFLIIHPNYSLEIVGLGNNDDYNKNINNFISSNFHEGQVVFYGQRKDVFDFMRRAKALIVPSRFEGFGFITAEAMANGCLVIGKNNAGTKEQFDNGLIQTGQEIGLRYNTEDELVECLCKSVEQDHSEMVQRARKVVLDNYTIEKSSSKLLSYYNYVINDFNGNKNIN